MPEPVLPLRESLRRAKVAAITNALAAHGGNRTRAAIDLRIRRDSLYKLCRRLGIRYPYFRPAVARVDRAEIRTSYRRGRS